jgi:hypothetical protein
VEQGFNKQDISGIILVWHFNDFYDEMVLKRRLDDTFWRDTQTLINGLIQYPWRGAILGCNAEQWAAPPDFDHWAGLVRDEFRKRRAESRAAFEGARA